MGTYIFKGEKTPNAIPAIVSAELFNEVAAKMNKNKKASAANKAIDEKFILTTKLFCGHCGTGMSGTSGTGKSGKRFHYYICMAVKKKSGCKKKSVSQAWIEDLILSECRKALTDENISLIANEVMEICEKEKDRTEYNRLEKTYKDMDKKKANLVNSLQNTENENLQKMIYEQFEVLDRQQVEIKKEMLNQENMQNTLSREMILFFLNDLKNGDINDFKYRELLVNIFVNKIYLFDDKITIVFNTQGETVDVNIEFIESFGCSDIKQSSPYKLITFKSA